MKSFTEMRNCPHCGTNWVDKPIPKEYRHNYSPPYFYSRVIGIYDTQRDGVTHYVCPDCKTEFPRFSNI
jgi:hypothetical protein